MSAKSLSKVLGKFKNQNEKRAVEEVRREKNPQTIIKLAGIHHSEVGGFDEYTVDVTGYKEKLAATENPNTPTLFLFYLYHYPRPKQKEFNTSDIIGPGSNDGSAPYVNSEVRDAVKAALNKRNWKLTAWERKNLSAAEIDFFERQLEKDRPSNMLRSSTSKTPLGGISRELIDLLKSR